MFHVVKVTNNLVSGPSKKYELQCVPDSQCAPRESCIPSGRPCAPDHSEPPDCMPVRR